MRLEDSKSYHVNFTIAAEFREKIRRNKDDFGATGMFFSCETLRGIYDFPVYDANYFEKEDFAPLDVVLIDGRVCMKTGRIILQPISFRSADGELMSTAEKLIEYGFVSGVVKVGRDGYERREDGATIPRVECKGMAFSDKFVNQELYNALPADDTVNMTYFSQISLDTSYERRDNNLQRRASWILSGQRVEPIRVVNRRPVDKKEERVA